jgi:V-type H+-transporting ATPase subunit D
MESPSNVLNDSGVYLPAFESVTEGGSDFGMTGLGRGGQQVQRLRLHHMASS